MARFAAAALVVDDPALIDDHLDWLIPVGGRPSPRRCSRRPHGSSPTRSNPTLPPAPGCCGRPPTASDRDAASSRLRSEALSATGASPCRR